MHKHGIRTLSRLSGLSPLTIRAWEARYQVTAPQRDGRGHRLYSSRDVRRLLLLAQARRVGLRIGEIVGCSNEQLQRLIAAEGGTRLGSATQRLAGDTLHAVEHYDADAVLRTLQQAIVQLTPLETVQAVLAPVLREVGTRWSDGRMSIAQEHLLSTCVERLMYFELQRDWQSRGGTPLICGCLSGEQHGLGSLLMGYLASTAGYAVHYVGVDLPPQEMLRLIQRTGARIVALAAVNQDSDFPAQLRWLAAAAPPQVLLAAGGAAAVRLATTRLEGNCRLLRDADEFLELLLQSA